MEYYISMVCESVKMKWYFSFKGCLLVLREKFKFLHLVFPKYFHCAIRIISFMLSRPEMIIKKFKGIVKLWLELNIALSESKLACGTLDSGLETALRTQKSSLHVLNMGLGGVKENVNGVSKVVQVWVQRFVFLKAILSLFYPTKL